MISSKNQENPPLESDEITEMLGKSVRLWTTLTSYLAKSYNHEPVVKREGKDNTWVIRYRKGGKTLVTLYPKPNMFTILIVLGREEVTRVRGMTLNNTVMQIFQNSRQFHDGRWLWITPKVQADLNSVKTLLALKRKPKN